MPVSESLAKQQGHSIKEAGWQFAQHWFHPHRIAETPGIISNQMFNLPGMTPELAARNVIGIMLGATPPTMGNLQGIFYDWLHERTMWRNQAALHRKTGGARPSYAEASEALRHALAVSMCKRPSPELLFRTCKGEADGSSFIVERKLPRKVDDENPDQDALQLNKGDQVYLPLASATQWAICQEAKYPGALESGVHVVFGGNRDGADAPVHACPGRKMAMGAMLGIIAAFLDAGRLQAQPAGLIVRISDWS